MHEASMKLILASKFVLKPYLHGQICIRIYFYSRVQICPCEQIYSRMQNLLHMQMFNLNFTYMQILSCERRKVKLAYICNLSITSLIWRYFNVVCVPEL